MRSENALHTWPLASLGAYGAAALFGLASALVMPRGPVTTTQALGLMAGSLLIGAAGGYLLRSRWALLILPLLHLVAFELGRIGAAGPTVDLPRLDNAFGILALLLGRGVYLVLGVLPQVIGVGFGLTLARRLAGASVNLAPTAALLVALAALAAWLLLPARTPPLRDALGMQVPGSFAELASIDLGGRRQAITIRGHDLNNPVLLYLSGGPGQSDLPYSRVLFEDLSRQFVIVGWDQRGTGKSYPALEPTTALTLDRLVEDTIELSEYLIARFAAEKIYLLGESWGSTLGVLAAQRRPELFYGYIGSGQMVSQSLSDRIIWRDLLAYAQTAGDWQLYDRVLTLGEPPYDDVPYSNAFVMTQYGKLYAPYTPPAAYVRKGSEARLGPYGIFGSEYTLIEKVNVLRGLVDMFAIVYPQLQGLDLRSDVPRLDVPVFLLDGLAELRGRRDLALEWFEALQAPLKRRYTFENAAHSVAFEQFEALSRIAAEEIVPLTYRRGERAVQ